MGRDHVAVPVDRVGRAGEEWAFCAGWVAYPDAAPEPGWLVSELARHLRRMWRAALQPGSLLSADEAAEALPCTGLDAQAWLLSHVAPVGTLAGAAVFRWGDVLSAVEAEGRDSAGRMVQSGTRWFTTAQAAAQLGVPRSTLDDMVARAPADLPGAPIHVGDGRHRHHFRWDPERIPEWWAAFQQWEATHRARTAVPAPRPRSRRPGSQPDRGAVDWGSVVRDYGAEARGGNGRGGRGP